ncbi:hypothetical protein LCGC14_1449240 [marine sediment metagenome]|uniref:Tetratricopeptide repeat protein n=1 Tax=marine sediment metagenome TaxID=412755 RepID=A0A0F9JJ14_9ZZZZ|nr:hypothetical protein [Phycisphaerae bacterium]HDZ42502.1 hypothetical protein [Phycisphaerae bacterium]
MQTTRIIIICLVIGIGAVVVHADEVWLGKLPYRGATVTGMEDGQLVFRTRAGSTVRRAISEVTLIALEGRVDFNTAEKAFQAGQDPEALKAYRQALRSAQVDWLADLIAYRRLAAMERSGQIDKALQQWQAIYRATKGSASALALMPRTLGPVGSQANTNAIEVLTANRPEQDTTDRGRQVTELLVKLYELEGREEELAREAARLAGTLMAGDSDEDAPDEGTPDETTPAPVGDLAARLKATETLVGAPGTAARAVELIEQDLDAYEAELLPQALLLLGKAKRTLADHADGDEARALLLAAGVNFMAVVAHFSETTEAAEALFEAARVNAALGNTRAARQAYDAVRSRYTDSPMAKRAAEALAEMDKTD